MKKCGFPVLSQCIYEFVHHMCLIRFKKTAFTAMMPDACKGKSKTSVAIALALNDEQSHFFPIMR